MIHSPRDTRKPTTGFGVPGRKHKHPVITQEVHISPKLKGIQCIPCPQSCLAFLLFSVISCSSASRMTPPESFVLLIRNEKNAIAHFFSRAWAGLAWEKRIWGSARAECSYFFYIIYICIALLNVKHCTLFFPLLFSPYINHTDANILRGESSKLLSMKR